MWRVPSSSLLLLACIVLGAFAQDRECVKDDFVLEYTMCGFDQMHDLIAYKKSGVVCSGGVTAESLFKFNQPCGVGCGSGLYQPFGETYCMPCMPGSYSIGGAYVWDDWHALPDNMGVPSVSCESVNGGSCSSTWELAGKYLSTASLAPHQSAIFQLNIFLQVPGHLTFLYRDDASPGNSEFKLQEYTQTVFTVDQANKNGIFHEYSYNLSSGAHSLRWVYTTFDNPESASAQISYLELADGQTWKDVASDFIFKPFSILEALPTFPRMHVDWVLFGGAKGMEPAMVSVVDVRSSNYSSDHFPIVSLFQIKK